MHSLRIANRDIKPDNMVFASTGKRVKAMIIDFTLAETIKHGQLVDHDGGTPAFEPPEAS